MSLPWTTLERVETDDGTLELRRRGDGDFLITIAGRVLMNSASQRSETELARLACAPLCRSAPRVLIGGLGMGLTLRAALEALPDDARVEVAELTETVVDWCRGPLGVANRNALDDPRVELHVEDVARTIERAGQTGSGFDAIAIDLYEGPHDGCDSVADPFYGARAIERTRRALRPGGIFAVWSEDPSSAFEKRLGRAGFEVTRYRPGRGGRRHAVTVATLPTRSASESR